VRAIVRRAIRGPVVAAVVGAALAAAPVAGADGPPRLSRDRAGLDVDSRYGSGAFGSWRVDRFGLPFYRYGIDPETDPRARQPELGGDTDAWHQLGNDHVVATAHNRGYVRLWSQDRAYEWTNRYEPESGHYAGGYGYLRIGDRTISTLYADRPPGARTRRDFGAGYFHRSTATGTVEVDERVYAPFGDAPLLLHDVTIANASRSPLRASWFEYWDINPFDEARDTHLGLAAPKYSKRLRTLSVAQLPDTVDRRPLRIFAAALRGGVRQWETDGSRFFGAGGRGKPAEVAAGRLSESIATRVPSGQTGSTMFAFQTPVSLAPGESLTLRYAYGAAHGERIPRLVRRWRAAEAPFARSQRAWARWVAKVDLGERHDWLSRELAWDAYMLRSGATYEETCGHHIVSQGGYYQYDFGWQAAFRDPLQHILPLVYSSPFLAREVLLYSAQEQSRATGRIPYGMTEMCRPLNRETSNDLDLWLLLAAAEYGLATRDLRFFRERVPWSDAGGASLWAHLRRAFEHQESLRGPHGGYSTEGAVGDWSDLSTTFLGMTESMLVTAQAAYVYPRLAELADARGDRPFAARLRAAAAELRAVLRREWTGRGWYSRGYAGDRQLGRGVVYGEPQPWAILAGLPDRDQAASLVANIRRFLTGVGAPPETHGPARIGSSQSPARNDPAVTERTDFAGLGGNNAVFVGGAWYSINGWLTWALGELEGIVARAESYAFDELRRNTLASHANAYPGHWNGVISVDDVCFAHYSDDPSGCGIGFTDLYDTQIMHQPAWSLFDTIKLAGIKPTRRGYEVDPHLPMQRFSLRLPRVGVAYEPGRARGYLRLIGAGRLRMAVAVPGSRRSVRAFVDGRRVHSRVRDGAVRFWLRGGRTRDWAVTW
jgi:Glycosyl hydrolase 36 superfamily, catalytic domain/Glycosyltransferase family 36